MTMNPPLTFCTIPTCSLQTPQGSTFKTLQVITAYFLFYQHSPSDPFHYIFPSPSLPITSFKNYPLKTKSSTYNNSNNEPSLTSSVRTSITMINKNRLKADSKQTPTFTENELDSSPSTETLVLQSL